MALTYAGDRLQTVHFLPVGEGTVDYVVLMVGVKQETGPAYEDTQLKI